MNHPDQARLPETCASTQAGASSTTCACSVPAAPISSASPATWKPAAAPGAPSPGGYAPSRGSTATRSKKNSSITHPPHTSGARGWTTSPTPPRWTVTSSARCWSPPARPARRACADLPAGPQRLTGLRSHRRRHRGPRDRARAPDTRGHPQGREDRHHPARATHRASDRPGHRRTVRGAGPPDPGRPAAGPSRRRPDRPPGRPPRRDHQPVGPHTLRHAFITAAQFRCRGAAAGRAGSRFAR